MFAVRVNLDAQHTSFAFSHLKSMLAPTSSTRYTTLINTLESKPSTAILLEAANIGGTSNVGGRGVYEAGDQRNMKDSEINDAEIQGGAAKQPSGQ